MHSLNSYEELLEMCVMGQNLNQTLVKTPQDPRARLRGMLSGSANRSSEDTGMRGEEENMDVYRLPRSIENIHRA